MSILGLTSANLTAVANTVNLTKLMEKILVPHSTLNRVYNGLTSSPAALIIIGAILTFFTVLYFSILRGRFYGRKTKTKTKTPCCETTCEICYPPFKGFQTIRRKRPRNRPRRRRDNLTENPIVFTVFLNRQNATVLRSWVSQRDARKENNLHKSAGKTQSGVCLTETASQTMHPVVDLDYLARLPIELIDEEIQVDGDGDCGSPLYLDIDQSPIDRIFYNCAQELARFDAELSESADEDGGGEVEEEGENGGRTRRLPDVVNSVNCS